jgi:hypothetical protein
VPSLISAVCAWQVKDRTRMKDFMFSQRWLWRLHHMGYKSLYSVESQLTFGGTCRLHPQGWRKKRTRNKHSPCYLHHTCFLLSLFFDHGGEMFGRNVASLSTDYTALYPRR